MSKLEQRRGLSIAILACLLTGCSLPGPPISPAKQIYWLQGVEELNKGSLVRSGSCATLRISNSGSVPGFMTSRMAYTTEPKRLDYFAYHEWVDTPAKMITTMIESRLDHIGMFGAVVSGSPDIRTDYRLDSELKRLLQVFNTSSSRVVLTIKVNLITVSDHSLLNSRTFDYMEPASGANPEAGVAAANRAAENFLVDLAAFVSESVEQFDCSPQD